MAADVAMTKKGFGEMAITGCIAGPIFNVLIGIGLSTTISILKSDKGIFNEKIVFSLWSTLDNGQDQFNKVAVLPLVLLVGQLVILAITSVNVYVNKF
jgi:Ca2+/Na+ antiporter